MTTYIPSPDQGPAFHEDPASWSLALWGGREMRRKAWTEKRYTDADWKAFNPSPGPLTKCARKGCLTSVVSHRGVVPVCVEHWTDFCEGRVPVVEVRISGLVEWQSEHDRRRGYAPGKVGHPE